MVEVCGDKDLMRAAGGQTVDEPCKGITGLQIYCNPLDAKDWQVRVSELLHMMVITWNALYELEEKKGKRDHTSPGSNLRTWWEIIEARVKGTEDPSWWEIGTQTTNEAVARYVGIVQDQACIIATMRKYIKEAGGKPPPIPFVKPKSRLELDEIIAEAAKQAQQQTPKIVNAAIVIGGIAAIVYVLRPVISQALLRRTSPAPRIPIPKPGVKK